MLEVLRREREFRRHRGADEHQKASWAYWGNRFHLDSELYHFRLPGMMRWGLMTSDVQFHECRRISLTASLQILQ